MKNDNWIPVSSGYYPAPNVGVQVTYKGYDDNTTAYCDAFAYRNEGRWYWSWDDSPVKVEIIAWKHNCQPYNG